MTKTNSLDPEKSVWWLGVIYDTAHVPTTIFLSLDQSWTTWENSLMGNQCLIERTHGEIISYQLSTLSFQGEIKFAFIITLPKTAGQEKGEVNVHTTES